MNILLSVFECNPLRGSDSFVGWSYVINAAKYNNVYALTREENKKDIEFYCSENIIDNWENIHFIYVQQSLFFTKYLYKLNHHLGFLGSYYLWQRRAYNVIRKDLKYQLIHHVSIADYRVIGYWYRIGVPYIIGPVGGAQETPNELKCYTKGHSKEENVRCFLNRFLTRFPSYKKEINSASIIYCSNDETLAIISKMSCNKNRVIQKTELCIDESYIQNRETLIRNNSKIVHIIVSGRLMYRKGIELLIDVVSKINCNNSFVVDIYGDGKDRRQLEEKVKSMNLQDKIIFHGKVDFDTIQSVYKEADIYTLPSLRETTGTAVIEAMANKLPVVALNQNGVKHLVKNDAGILVDISSKDKLLTDYACALAKLIDNPKLRLLLGNIGFERVKKEYTWQRRAEEMSIMYTKLTD